MTRADLRVGFRVPSARFVVATPARARLAARYDLQSVDLLYFVVLVGALIFVHELGHFVWAKAFGVKVLRFSVGFGPKLLGTRIGDTEYVLAAFPLGGYVKMLGESPADVIEPDDHPRSFGAQPLWKRVIIVLAGPAMNLVFPLGLFFLVYLGENELTPPTVGTVFPEMPADGRLLPGDRILAVDSDPISSFEELTAHIRESPERPVRLFVARDGVVHQEIVTPTRAMRLLDLERSEVVGRIGIVPHEPTNQVGVVPGSPAEAAGLRTFDLVLSVNGQPVSAWRELDDAFRDQRSAVPVTYLRPTRNPEALGGLAALDLFDARVAQITPSPGAGSGALRAGLEPADLYVRHVRVGSAEAELGLRPGDRLVSVDGRPIRLFASLVATLEDPNGGARRLQWRHGSTLREGELRLPREVGINEHGQRFERVALGMEGGAALRVGEPVENPSPLRSAAVRAWESTREMVSLTLYSVVRLLQGRLGVETLGGPLMIFDVAGQAAREGGNSYLKLMAFVSVNLGLINLLPVPLLDGGHLLFFLIEAITRRPVPRRVRTIASYVGLVLLLALMALALKNDLRRRFEEPTPAVTRIQAPETE
ncbi:MAG: RIP metalloprotease RseP [Sandaracinus sp.]|nr:RIP metalloprotease RseP [Sandaracinus sp.]